MPDPAADPAGVRIEYDTELDDAEIQPYISRANREVERHTDADGMDTQRRADLEAALAAYWIATRSEDRAAEEVTTGRTTIAYENEVVQDILATVRSLDPSGNLPPDRRDQAHFEVF